MAKIIIFIIKIYQYVVSPANNPCCRFYPSCSAYSVEAIQAHGFLKGLFYSAYRIMRYNRFCSAGIDLVPVKTTKDLI